MPIPLQVWSANDLIYGYLLSARYRSPWVYEPSNALLTDPDIWEVLRNDSSLLATMQRRDQNILRPWRVVPPVHTTSKYVDPRVSEASRRLAAICSEALANISRLDAGRKHLLKAFYLGRSYSQIEWEEKLVSLDGTPPMIWYLPIHLKDCDRRRFHWVPEWTDKADGTRAKTGVHIDMFDTNRQTWVTLTEDERRHYVEYIWDNTEDRIGHGRGAAEALFFTHYFKTQTIKKIMEGIDRYANGFIIGKLDALRASSTDLSSDQLTTKTKTFLQTIRSEHVGVLENVDDVKVLEMPTSGMEFSLDVVRYFNEEAERLCNGSVRAAGHSVDGTGARAQAQVEAETSEAFYQFPREDLDDVIDRELLGSFLYWNEANLEQLGLGDAKRPKFESAQIKKQDPQTRVEVLKSLAEIAPVLASELYDAAEATPPGPDDEVIGGPGSALDPRVQAQQQLEKRLAHDRPGAALKQKTQQENPMRETKHGEPDGDEGDA